MNNIATWMRYECLDDIRDTYYKCSCCGGVLGVPHGTDVFKIYPHCTCGAQMLEDMKDE